MSGWINVFAGIFAVFLVWKVLRQGQAKSKAQLSAASNGAPQSAANVPPGSPWRQRFAFQDFTPCDLSKSAFIEGFGVRRRMVVQLVRFAPAGLFSELPAKVRKLVEQSYDEGLARGQEISQFRAGNGPLKANESLYLALVDIAGDAKVICFVHGSPNS